MLFQYDMSLVDRRLGVLVGLLAVAAFLTARRIPGRQASPPTEADPIDVASADSFPASDPPSWTRTVAEAAEGS